MTRRERENQRIDELTKPIDERALETATMKSNLESQLRDARKDQLVNYSKSIGKTVLPVLGLAAFNVGVAYGTHYLFESKDLANLITLGAGVAIGFMLGTSGAVEEYFDWVRGAIDDIKYTRQRIRDYKTQCNTLE